LATDLFLFTDIAFDLAQALGQVVLMGFVAGEKGGGLVAGELRVIDLDPRTK